MNFVHFFEVLPVKVLKQIHDLANFKTFKQVVCPMAEKHLQKVIELVCYMEQKLPNLLKQNSYFSQTFIFESLNLEQDFLRLLKNIFQGTLRILTINSNKQYSLKDRKRKQQKLLDKPQDALGFIAENLILILYCWSLPYQS